MENNPNDVGMAPQNIVANYINTSSGKQELVDPDGYTYWCQKDRKNGRKNWECDLHKTLSLTFK